jgi:hypothetical protein
MKIAKFNAGELLRTLDKEIKEAAKQAGVDRGALNNALLRASPKDVDAVKKLLLDAKTLVTVYLEKQGAKAVRQRSPHEAAIQSITTGTKTNPSKLAIAATAAGISKTELNAALMHFIGQQKEPTPEGAEAALRDPKGLIDALAAHKSAVNEKNKSASKLPASSPEI